MMNTSEKWNKICYGLKIFRSFKSEVVLLQGRNKMTCNVKIANYTFLKNFDVQWSSWEITICFDTASFLPFEAYFLIFEMKIAISLFAAANGNV